MKGILVRIHELEQLSFTTMLTGELKKWNRSTEHPKLGAIGTRTIGFIATPFTSLIDMFVHTFIFVGKFFVGGFVSSYNFVAKQINSKNKLPKDLEVSFSLIHLALAIENLVRAPVLPLYMLLCPERVDYLIPQPRFEEYMKTVEDAQKKLDEFHDREKTRKEIGQKYSKELDDLGKKGHELFEKIHTIQESFKSPCNKDEKK